MAEYAAVPCHGLLQRNCFRVRDLLTRNQHFETLKRKHFNGNNRVIRNFSRGTCKFSASGPKMLRGSHQLRDRSLRCCCLGTLVDLDGVTPSNWVSIVDQVLLMTSVVLTSMAGVVPTESSSSGKNDLGHDAFLENSTSFGSSIKNDPQFTSKTVWDAVKRKLLGALSAIEHDGNLENRVVECEKQSAKLPLNLYAISEGPRLRLLWATFQRVEKEVVNMSGNYEMVNNDELLTVLPEILQKSSQPICMEWLENEILLAKRKPDKTLLSLMFEKLKGDETMLVNIKKLGKEDLYAEILFFLRFGFPREGCCYGSKLLAEHGIDILEDLVITLADGIASIYLELISVDSNICNEINSLGLVLCSLSTRVLQRLRNEEALKQWLHQNMESVILMYEDRFDLWTLQIQLLDSSHKSQNKKLHWWNKLMFGNPSSILPPLYSVVISQLSVPVKRTKELRALAGWRYYFSLILEFSDVAMPLVRVIIAKVSSAISFFLVCLIGRSLGLIYTGIRQSLGWR